MKHPLTLIILAVAVAGTGWLLVPRDVQHDRPPLTTPAAPAPARTSPATADATRTAEGASRTHELEARLADESRARQRAESEADELRQSTAPLAGKVIVSLGTIDDIGSRTGTVLPALHDLSELAGRKSTSLSPEEKARLLELQRKHAEVLGMLPEIAGFQDTPTEYGRFFRSMLQQAAGLTDPQASRVEDYMRSRGESLVQLGLNTAKEPTDPALEEKWEAQRDAFNEITADGLKRILPPGAADKAGLSAELMEFLEMDFDKLTPKSPARP